MKNKIYHIYDSLHKKQLCDPELNTKGNYCIEVSESVENAADKVNRPNTSVCGACFSDWYANYIMRFT